MTNEIEDEGSPRKVTVFTATFNRAHTLVRAYESLCAQTLRDFEWLIVDDGSTDGTNELVAQWSSTAPFPIRYFWQANAGKHVAYNCALAQAKGVFFTPLDSDDACEPQALDRLLAHWETIPEAMRPQFSGVGCLCRDQHGTVIGRRFPTMPFDANVRDLYYSHRIVGEKWGMQRTDILRRYPFPLVSGTKFVPEAVVWNDIGKKYRLRWVNEPLRIYYQADEGTGATLSRHSLLQNAPGKLYYCKWLLNNDLDFFLKAPLPFVKAAVLLPLVAVVSGAGVADAWRGLHSWKGRLLLLAASPLAALVACTEYMKGTGK